MRSIVIWLVVSLLVSGAATIATDNMVAGIYLGSVLMVGVLSWSAGEIRGYNIALDERVDNRKNVRVTEERPNNRAKQQTSEPGAFMGEVVIEQRETT